MFTFYVSWYACYWKMYQNVHSNESGHFEHIKLNVTPFYWDKS